MRRRSSSLHLGIVPRGDSNNQVDKHAEPTFKVIRLPIPQKVPNDKNGQDNQDDQEQLKIETHLLPQPPAHNYNQRRIQQRGLDRRAKTMKERKVDLIVPGTSQLPILVVCGSRENCTYHASSMAVKCSAAFSTSGTKIRPMKLSDTPLSSTMWWISWTKKTADRHTQAKDTAIARMHSVSVSLARLISLCRSSSRCSSFSSTSSNILLWLWRLYHKNLRMASVHMLWGDIG